MSRYAFVLVALGLVSGDCDAQGEVQSDGRTSSTRSTDSSTSHKPAPRGFLKSFTVESFGFSSASNDGELVDRQVPANDLSSRHGLECPRCIALSSLARTRYTLPAFGAAATLRLRANRTEVFAGFGGINALHGDNTTIDVAGGSFRNSSFNDSWLLQSWIGVRSTIDRNSRLWIDATERHVDNFGPIGPKHWNTISTGATLSFGRH